MRIATAPLLKSYLLLAVTYYIGYWSFLVGLFQGGGGSGDAFSANAAGSLDRQLLGATLLLGGVLLLVRLSRRRLPAILAMTFWWLLLVGYFFASTYWSYAPGVTLRRTVAFLTLVVAAYCAVEFFEPASLLKLCARAIGIAGALGLLYAVVAPGDAFIAEGGRQNAFLGIFADKNTGARMYAYAVIIMAGIGHWRDRRDLATVLVCCLCLLISQSVSAVVMLLAGSGVTLACRLLHSRFQQVNLRRFIGLTLLLVALSVAAFHLYGALLAMVGRDPTLTNRSIIWELLAPYVEAEYWFGYGFGAFWASSAVSAFLERWGYIGNAHSTYVEALLHGGVVCLVLTVLILAKALKEGAVSYILHPDGAMFAPILAIVAVQTVINSVAFIVLNHNSFDMFLFTIAYFIAVRGAIHVRLRSRQRRRRPALQGLRAGVLR